MYYEPLSRQTTGAGGPSPGPDEVTLVARAQDGDLVAFEQLVDRHESRLLGLCIRMLRNRTDAEDIVQDTFLTTWRRLESLQDPAAFKPWMFRLASNGCLDFLRRREGKVDGAELRTAPPQANASVICRISMPCPKSVSVQSDGTRQGHATDRGRRLRDGARDSGTPGHLEAWPQQARMRA